MKTISKSIFFLFMFFFSFDTYSQIKVLCNGNVGIGSTNPSNWFEGKVLEIYDSRPILKLTNSGGDGLSTIAFTNTSISSSHIGEFHVNYLYVPTNPTKSKVVFCGSGGWTEPLSIFANGTIGINNSNPQYTLDVNGDIATGGTLRIASDERLKEDIKPLTNCLENLNKLNGKQYKKNIITKHNSMSKDSLLKTSIKDISDESVVKQEEYGVIAQDLQKVFPVLVKADSAGMLTVNYIGLIPVLIESVKELNTKTESIKQLAERINALETQLKTCCNSSNLKSAQLPLADNPGDAQEEVSSLDQNFPNPFNQSTQIGYYLPEAARTAALYIYNMNGQQIKSIPIQSRGKGNITINGSELMSGMYIYSLIVDGKEIDTKRMILTN